MKSTLEFNLPEDSRELNLSLSACKLLHVIQDMRDAFRRIEKCGALDGGKLTEAQLEGVEMMQKKLFEIIEDNDVNLSELG